MSRLLLLSLVCLHFAANAMQVKRNKPRIRIDPPESVADPNSYAYIRAAKARAEQNNGLEDDLALFADLPEPIPLEVGDSSVVEQAEVPYRCPSHRRVSDNLLTSVAAVGTEKTTRYER